MESSVARPRLAWWMIAPAVGAILLVALFPLAWTVWESLHLHDLRMPWLGRPFIGLGNYLEAMSDPRFWAALAHTGLFAAVSVSLELAARNRARARDESRIPRPGTDARIGARAVGNADGSVGPALEIHVRR